MSNPFTVLLLQTFDTYRSFNPLSPQKQTIPRALLYTVGITALTAVIYRKLSAKDTHNFLTTFVRSFKYLLNNKRHIATAKQHTEEQILFEDKYFKEYDEWVSKQSPLDDNYVIVPAETTHKKGCLENMYNVTIRETIDDFYSDVIMCYDHATFSFAYYARTANIPYKYLETISRKYMIETNAPREIHVDIRNEIKKAKERNLITVGTTASRSDNHNNDNTDNNDNDNNNDDDDNVFVKLKSYNTVSNLNIHTTTNDTKEKTHKFVSAKNTSLSGTSSESKPTMKNKIIREKANRYSYRGKIHEFEENHKRTATSAANATNTIVSTDAITREEPKDYAEFKKQMMKTRSAL